jgi:Trypsin
MYVSSEGIPLYFPREIETKAMALTETSGFDTEDGIEGSILERIVGGEQTRPGAYPFFVRIDNEGSQHCGGSLISSDVVLTAGNDITYCVDYLNECLSKKLWNGSLAELQLDLRSNVCLTELSLLLHSTLLCQ